jgi:hypothetical protein
MRAPCFSGAYAGGAAWPAPCIGTRHDAPRGGPCPRCGARSRCARRAARDVGTPRAASRGAALAPGAPSVERDTLDAVFPTLGSVIARRPGVSAARWRFSPSTPRPRPGDRPPHAGHRCRAAPMMAAAWTGDRGDARRCPDHRRVSAGPRARARDVPRAVVDPGPDPGAGALPRRGRLRRRRSLPGTRGGGVAGPARRAGAGARCARCRPVERGRGPRRDAVARVHRGPLPGDPRLPRGRRALDRDGPDRGGRELPRGTYQRPRGRPARPAVGHPDACPLARAG